MFKADKSTTYTKTQIENKFTAIGDTVVAASSGTYTETEIDNALGAKANTADVAASLLEKQNKFDLTAPLMWNLNIEHETVDLMVDS